MTASADRLHRGIFLLTAGLLFSAAALRSVLGFAGDDLLVQALVLLAAWLALFGLEAVVTPRWPSFFPLYLAAQTAIVVVLLSLSDFSDFYAVLFGVMSMQAVQRAGWKTALLWIALFTPLTALALTFGYDPPEALALAAVYTGFDVFLALFTVATRRADEARARNQALTAELAQANDEIEAYSRRIERLAAAGERRRLARELHDSVTQTVFGMNLTAQSAALLLSRDRAGAAAQLDRLEGLARSALAEIRALGSELAAGELDEEGLAAALRRNLAGRLPDGLSLTLDVDEPEGASTGDGLSAAEEHCLFRIAQEALNNSVKHAQADAVAIRLRLAPPRRLEIEDDGRGFDLSAGQSAGGMGLGGMRERAAEIGWSFRVTTAPGAGTRVVVEQETGDARA
jgi:signal transduction histidine kinase